MDKTFTYLTQVEQLAQEILTQKENKLLLSNAQNKLREAQRALQQNDDRNVWLKVGSVHINLPREECRGILAKDYGKISEDISDLECKIKDGVGRLRDLEHLPGIEGFRLKPMTGVEAKAIHKAFGMS